MMIKTAFACETSTLRLPEPDHENDDDDEWVSKQRARRSNPAGSRPYAQDVLSTGTSWEHIVARCPALMTEMHEKGAPLEINCAIALAHYCEATQ